jgi:hypothetical protein
MGRPPQQCGHFLGSSPGPGPESLANFRGRRCDSKDGRIIELAFKRRSMRPVNRAGRSAELSPDQWMTKSRLSEPMAVADRHQCSCRIDNRGIDLERGSKSLYILTDEDNGQLLRIVPRCYRPTGFSKP